MPFSNPANSLCDIKCIPTSAFTPNMAELVSSGVSPSNAVKLAKLSKDRAIKEVEMTEEVRSPNCLSMLGYKV